MNDQKEFYLANLLYDAIDSMDMKGVKLILFRQNINPNYLIPNKGITPFHLAVGLSDVDFSFEITKLFLDNGGDPNVRSEEGYTPLHIATLFNRLDLFKLLISYGSDPEVIDSYLKTPDDYAIESGYTDISIFLGQIITSHSIAIKDNMKATYNYELDKIILQRGDELMEMQFYNHYDFRIIPLITKPSIDKDIKDMNNKKSRETSNIDNGKDFSSERNNDQFVLPNNKRNKNVNVTKVDELLNTAFKESGTDTFYTCSEHSDSVECSSIVTRSSNGLQCETRKYEDKSENLVYYERRISSIPKIEIKVDECNKQSSQTSSLTSNASTTELREALSTFGYQSGPITSTTKSLYVKKLHELKRHYKHHNNAYSKSLQRTLERSLNDTELEKCKRLESLLMVHFGKPDKTQRWREGTRKTSFNYLLLDPRITLNLPERHKDLDENDAWKIFISSIFYIGKGKKIRPYDHLYEAIKYYNNTQKKSLDKKVQHIIDIWQMNFGVVCLHVFHNSIPVEAYTREAAMISAINLKNLKNVKNGEYYGPAVSWNEREKNLYGTVLLRKCMSIYLLEGEKQILPNDF